MTDLYVIPVSEWMDFKTKKSQFIIQLIRTNPENRFWLVLFRAYRSNFHGIY